MPKFGKNKLKHMIEAFTEKIKLLMVLHYSHLSEKDRRQYAALESLKLGRGGTSYISQVLAINRNTIMQGIKELTATAMVPIPTGRQRRQGGGRKKKDRRATGHSKFINKAD